MTSDPSGSPAMSENPAPSSIPPPSDQAPPSVSDASTHGPPDEDGAPSDECEQRPSCFDPKALVEIGSALDHFEQVGTAAMTRAMSHLAHNTAAFASFDDGAISVTTGKFSFTVNRDRLCRAIVDVCTAARMPVRHKASNRYSVRLSLSECEIKLTTGGPTVFFETAIPTVSPVTGIAEAQRIAAELNLRQLKKLSRTAGSDDTLTVLYDAARKSLIIRSDVASSSPLRRNFEAQMGGELAQRYEKWLGPPRHVHQFDPHLLLTAVKFARLFVERDPLRPSWPLIVIRDGVASASLPDRIGAFASEKLAGLQLAIRHEHIGRLVNLLAGFEPSGTHLFDMTNHHVFYDGTTCLAFEKAFPPALPPLPPTLAGDCRSRIVVPRTILLSELNQLESICSSDRRRDFLVTLRIEGWPGARLYLQTQDGNEVSHGVGVTECTRIVRGAGISGISGRSAIYTRSFSLQTLCEVIAHFDSANVVLEEMQEGHLRIQDEGSDFQATSWIAAVMAPPAMPHRRGRHGQSH